jgi:hypothetical protein
MALEISGHPNGVIGVTKLIWDDDAVSAHLVSQVMELNPCVLLPLHQTVVKDLVPLTVTIEPDVVWAENHPFGEYHMKGILDGGKFETRRR